MDCGCGDEIRLVSSIAISVCKKIDMCDIEVEEKIDETCSFCELVRGRDYYLSDEYGGVRAEEGFRWLIIKNGGSYGKGICVIYRLSIDGKYTTAAKGIRVKTGENYLNFNCGIADGCFKVPGCNECTKFYVTKSCRAAGENIEFIVRIKNEGSSKATISILDETVIPKDVTIQFTDFNGWSATFDGSGNPVGLNQDIKGAKINIRGKGIDINPGETIQRVIKLKLRELKGCDNRLFITNTIPKNGLTSWGGSIPETNLPVLSSVKVETCIYCEDPCSQV